MYYGSPKIGFCQEQPKTKTFLSYMCLEPKARFPLPELTARVNRPS